MLEGDAAAGKRTTHCLTEGVLGPDLHWETPAELTAHLEALCSSVDAHAATFFERIENDYLKYVRLFDTLVKHYTSWFEQAGHELPQQDFYGTDDENGIRRVAAFSVFAQYIATEKLSAGLPEKTVGPCLWRFWHGDRPMRATDYRKGDYYACTKCKNLVARGRFEQQLDPVFGEHYAFFCKKH
jgi:hypothetical protein